MICATTDSFLRRAAPNKLTSSQPTDTPPDVGLPFQHDALVRDPRTGITCFPIDEKFVQISHVLLCAHHVGAAESIPLPFRKYSHSWEAKLDLGVVIDFGAAIVRVRPMVWRFEVL